MKKAIQKSAHIIKKTKDSSFREYGKMVAEISDLLESARRSAARQVNSIMTATYWEMGRRIFEYEQGGENRAEYGEELIVSLADDLTAKFGRGFGLSQLKTIRKFYLTYKNLEKSQSVIGQFKKPPASGTVDQIQQTLSAKSYLVPGSSIRQSLIATSGVKDKKSQSPIGLLPTLYALADIFPLPWTHYARLLRVRNEQAREFYEIEAFRGGWTVRQLDRQINSQFYERTALSRNKTAMLTKGARPEPGDTETANTEIRNPLVLEFLDLKDEYSESDLEDALIRHLETFLLELGGAFTFVGRQRRLRIDHEWFRVDLLFFHRRLRSLLVIDLKTGPLSHADIGQMHLYLNYAKEHWVEPGENPPVGLILCTEKGESLARYALEGLPNKTVVREYMTLLPDEKMLAREIERTRREIEGRRM